MYYNTIINVPRDGSEAKLVVGDANLGRVLINMELASPPRPVAGAHASTISVSRSSAIKGVTYDSVTRILDIAFTGGLNRVYRYTSVSLGTVMRFLSAESMGEFFNLRIRNVYTTVRL